MAIPLICAYAGRSDQTADIARLSASGVRTLVGRSVSGRDARQPRPSRGDPKGEIKIDQIPVDARHGPQTAWGEEKNAWVALEFPPREPCGFRAGNSSPACCVFVPIVVVIGRVQGGDWE